MQPMFRTDQDGQNRNQDNGDLTAKIVSILVYSPYSRRQSHKRTNDSVGDSK
jgi:hypothetical protein